MGVPPKVHFGSAQCTFAVGLSAISFDILIAKNIINVLWQSASKAQKDAAFIPNAKFPRKWESQSHLLESIIHPLFTKVSNGFFIASNCSTFTTMQVPFSIALLEPKDKIPLFELIQANAKRLHQYFPITVKGVNSLITTEYYIHKKMREVAEKENYTFKIVDNSTQLPVGILIIKKIDWENKACELAYFIDANYEGKGITSAGISQLMTYAKETLGLQSACLRIGEDNPGSLRIAEKHNFALTKRIKDGHEDFHGNVMDVLHFERVL